MISFIKLDVWDDGPVVFSPPVIFKYDGLVTVFESVYNISTFVYCKDECFVIIFGNFAPMNISRSANRGFSLLDTVRLLVTLMKDVLCHVLA